MRALLLLSTALLLSGCVYAPLDLGLGQLGQMYEVTVVDGDEDQKVLLVRLDGEITDEDGGLLGSANTLSSLKKQLDLARRDESIRAVILRVNSPGGGATASDLIHHELMRFREESKKPVLTWMQDVAASGGFYVAQATDWVVATKTCITGSIGVVADFPDVSGLGEKIGVKVEVIKSGERKDIGSPFRPMRPEERALLQGLIDGMYKHFVDVVVEGRSRVGLTRDKIVPIADGRVFTAPEALDLGLIDAIGYFEDVLRRAAEMGHMDDPEVVVYERKSLGGTPPTIYARAPGGLELELGGSELTAAAKAVLPKAGPKLRYQWMPGR